MRWLLASGYQQCLNTPSNVSEAKGEKKMSLDLEQIALHQLVKRDEQQLDVVLRDSLLAKMPQ